MKNKFLAVAVTAFIAIPALAEKCQLGSRYGFIGCGPTHKCDLRISNMKKSPKLSCVQVTTRKVARTIIDPQTKEVLRVKGLNKRVSLNTSAPSGRIAKAKVINKKGLWGFFGRLYNGVGQIWDNVEDAVRGKDDGNNGCGTREPASTPNNPPGVD